MIDTPLTLDCIHFITTAKDHKIDLPPIRITPILNWLFRIMDLKILQHHVFPQGAMVAVDIEDPIPEALYEGRLAVSAHAREADDRGFSPGNLNSFYPEGPLIHEIKLVIYSEYLLSIIAPDFIAR